MDKLDRILDKSTLDKGINMKCPHCGESYMEEKEEMPDIKESLLDDLINNVGSDDIGQKLEIIIAKKKKPELEMDMD